MKTVDKFRDYLLAAIPSEYPISSIPLSIKMTLDHRKELVFQQDKFLDEALNHSNQHPWIYYLSATKHTLLLQSYKTDTTTFPNIEDKEFFDSVQSKADQLIKLSSNLEQEVKDQCNWLISVQIYSSEVEKAIDAVKKGLALGLRSFPCKPDHRDGLGYLIIMSLFIIIYLCGDLGIVKWLGEYRYVFPFAALVAWSIITKASTEKDHYRALYYYATNIFSEALKYDAELQGKDLNRCLDALNGIKEKRDSLTRHYILPYV